MIYACNRCGERGFNAHDKGKEHTCGGRIAKMSEDDAWHLREHYCGTPPPMSTFRGAPGAVSNSAITRRNRGVRHQFLDDIGGCSANYR